MAVESSKRAKEGLEGSGQGEAAKGVFFCRCHREIHPRTTDLANSLSRHYLPKRAPKANEQIAMSSTLFSSCSIPALLDIKTTKSSPFPSLLKTLLLIG